MGVFEWNFWDSAFNSYQAGNFASVLGLIITFFGFGATLWNLARAKSAARQAELAANGVRVEISRFNTLVDISAAISTLDEIKRLQRMGGWAILPDRYLNLRRMLIAVRHSSPSLSEGHKSTIQAAIQYLADMESSVERANANGKPPTNVARLNKLLTDHADQIHQILMDIKSGKE